MSGKATGDNGRGYSAEIQINGLGDTVAALRSLAPDVLKRLRRRLKSLVSKIGSEAGGFGPPGHQLSYVVRESTRGKRVGMKLSAANAETAIFENAGTRMRSKSGGEITPQGAAMVRWLDAFGRPGRFMWEAWDRNKAETEAEIRAEMAAAERELQARLNAAGEVF